MADSLDSAPAGLSKGTSDLEIGDPSGKLADEVSFSDLEKFTDNFSNIIGGTKFALVYKGVWRDGRVVSVKKLDPEKSPLACGEEFRNKVQQHIMALKHDNVVKMVAFCREEKETAQPQGDGPKLVQSFICYEFSSKGSLDKYILAKPDGIDWDTRIKIIEGICHGLRYLHTRDMPVLHMDLNPSIIFLDDNMSPKIADFGLARILGKDETIVVEEKIMGTCGYTAPEYAYTGEISTRSDIYSLGILILEITTGELNHTEKIRHESTEEHITSGYPKLDSDRVKEVTARKYIDQIRHEWTEEHITSRYSKLGSDRLKEVKVCIRVGLECVEIEPTRRPSIDTIVEKLNAARTAS